MRYKYFHISEFDSPDEPGSGAGMSPKFLKMLDEAREIAERYQLQEGMQEGTQEGGQEGAQRAEAQAPSTSAADADVPLPAPVVAVA